MFCPKCGTKNIEDAKYCRACGADISLVPQALTKSLEGAEALAEGDEGGKKKKRKKKEKEPPTLEKGLSKTFEGLGYLTIVLLGYFYFRGGFLIWIWFIIPALSNIGEGLGTLISAGREPRALPPHSSLDQELLIPNATPHVAELPSRETAEIDDHPFSVTEGTTRHLDATGAAKK